MSRLITLPDGRQVTGCKNYVCTPCPDLLMTGRTTFALGLDADAQQLGATLSLYVQGLTYNTATPLKFYLMNVTSDARTITPAQFNTGIRIGLPARWDASPQELIFNMDAGSYELHRLALMLTSEMDEIMQSRHPLDTDWNHWYPA